MVTEIQLARVDEVEAKADDPHGDEAHTEDYASDPHGNEAHSATYIEDVSVQDDGAAVLDATTLDFVNLLDVTDASGVAQVDVDDSGLAGDPHGNAAHDPNMALESDLNDHTGDTTNPHQVGLEQARTQDDAFGGIVKMADNDLQIHDGAPILGDPTVVTSIEGYQGDGTGQDAPLSVDFSVYDDGTGSTFSEVIVTAPDGTVNRWTYSGVEVVMEDGLDMSASDIQSVGALDAASVDATTLTADEGSFSSQLETYEVAAQADIGASDTGFIVVTDDDRVVYRYE